jgi:hypothetical protein
MNYQIQGLSIHAEVHGTAEPVDREESEVLPGSSSGRKLLGYFIYSLWIERNISLYLGNSRKRILV